MRNICLVPKRLFSSPDRSEPTYNHLDHHHRVIITITLFIIIIKVICVININIIITPLPTTHVTVAIRLMAVPVRAGGATEVM